MVVWVAHHLAMPFSTTSAVHAWHRVGSLLSTIVRKFTRAPAAKFVHDFFGTPLVGVCVTGGHCLDVSGSVLAVPTKEVQSVSFASTLHLLCLTLAYVTALGISIAVGPEKAAKLSKIRFK